MLTFPLKGRFNTHSSAHLSRLPDLCEGRIIVDPSGGDIIDAEEGRAEARMLGAPGER